MAQHLFELDKCYCLHTIECKAFKFSEKKFELGVSVVDVSMQIIVFNHESLLADHHPSWLHSLGQMGHLLHYNNSRVHRLWRI